MARRLLWMAVGALGCTADQPPTCPDGQILAGETCLPEACGTGKWGDLPVGADTVYVDDDASPGGDGSASSPYQTIQDGADAAGSAGGTLVAIAAGTYLETLVLTGDHDGVHLAGRCRELVTVDGSSGEEDEPVVLVDASLYDELALSGLTVTGGWGGVVAYPGQVTLTRLTLDGNAAAGLVALWRARVTAHEVEVRHTGPMPDGTLGWGIDVENGSHLSCESCLVEGNTAAGVIVQGSNSVATLRDVEVRDTVPDEDGLFGRGLGVYLGAELTAEACLIEANHDAGVFANDEDTRVELHDVVVRGTLPRPDGLFGRGLVVQGGAELTADGCTVEGHHEMGVFLHGPGVVATLVDSEVRGNGSVPDTPMGRAIEVSAGATLTAEGCAVEDNHGVGVFVDGVDSSATLRHATVRGTRPLPDGTNGKGILVDEGAALLAESCTVDGNRDAGVAAFDPGTVVGLVDTVVRGTVSAPGGVSGYGLGIREGASLSTDGCTIEGNQGIGVQAWDPGTSVILADTTVRDTVPYSTGLGGTGIEVAHGADLSAIACTVQGNHGTGVVASWPDARATLTGTSILDTRRNMASSAAVGIVSQYTAELTAVDTAVRGTEGPGLWAMDGSVMTCEGCAIEGNTFAGAGLHAGGILSLSGCTVSGNGPDPQEGGGIGLFADDRWGGGNTLEITDSVVTGHPLASAFLVGPGAYRLVDNDLIGGEGVTVATPAAERQLHGDAVFAMDGVSHWDGAQGLLIEGNTLHDGVTGVFLHGASASLSGNSWAGNEVDVWQQGPAEVGSVDGDLTDLTVELDPPFDRAVLDDLDFALYLEDTAPSE